MNIDKVGDWLQIIASVGVVFGLILVAYELQQTESLSRASTVQSGYSLLSENERVVIGENPAATIAKACLRPGELTEDDFFVLDAIYTLRLLHLYMVQSQSQAFGPTSMQVEDTLRMHVGRIARTLPGRVWLEQESGGRSELWQQAVAAELRVPSGDCKSRMSSFIEMTRAKAL
jgi:hypothetical protein